MATTSPPPDDSGHKGWLLVGVIGVLALVGGLTYWAASGNNKPDDCEAVSPALIDDIESGLTVVGGWLSEGVSIRSTDFERVWFVAGDIAGPGIEEGSEVGVWATYSDPEGPAEGSIYSVNSKAMEFSDWGPGPGLSMSDGGAAEAEDCLDYV
jgi:hypothetical protein